MVTLAEPMALPLAVTMCICSPEKGPDLHPLTFREGENRMWLLLWCSRHPVIQQIGVGVDPELCQKSTMVVVVEAASMAVSRDSELKIESRR